MLWEDREGLLIGFAGVSRIERTIIYGDTDRMGF
jgi:hypothetical protein